MSKAKTEAEERIEQTQKGIACLSENMSILSTLLFRFGPRRRGSLRSLLLNFARSNLPERGRILRKAVVSAFKIVGEWRDLPERVRRALLDASKEPDGLMVRPDDLPSGCIESLACGTYEQAADCICDLLPDESDVRCAVEMHARPALEKIKEKKRELEKELRRLEASLEQESIPLESQEVVDGETGAICGSVEIPVDGKEQEVVSREKIARKLNYLRRLLERENGGNCRLVLELLLRSELGRDAHGILRRLAIATLDETRMGYFVLGTTEGLLRDLAQQSSYHGVNPMIASVHEMPESAFLGDCKNVVRGFFWLIDTYRIPEKDLGGLLLAEIKEAIQQVDPDGEFEDGEEQDRAEQGDEVASLQVEFAPLGEQPPVLGKILNEGVGPVFAPNVAMQDDIRKTRELCEYVANETFRVYFKQHKTLEALSVDSSNSVALLKQIDNQMDFLVERVTAVEEDLDSFSESDEADILDNQEYILACMGELMDSVKNLSDRVGLIEFFAGAPHDWQDEGLDESESLALYLDDEAGQAGQCALQAGTNSDIQVSFQVSRSRQLQTRGFGRTVIAMVLVVFFLAVGCHPGSQAIAAKIASYLLSFSF